MLLKVIAIIYLFILLSLSFREWYISRMKKAKVINGINAVLALIAFLYVINSNFMY